MGESSARHVRRVENGRLAYYGREADPGYWDSHWDKWLTEDTYKPYRKGYSGWLEAGLPFLPKEGRIIEAGCGLGVYVVGLRALGYDCEGVEWGPKTVELAKKHCPDLPIRQGDVTKLDVSDGYYSGYISMGVVEHDYEGPKVFLAEAYRVLAPGGIGLISVPFFGPLRRLKARLGMYRADVSGLEFYQYAYGKKEFFHALESAGFTILRTWAYDTGLGLDEIPCLGKAFNIISRLPKIGGRFWRLLLYSPVGHMLLAAVRKPASEGTQ